MGGRYVIKNKTLYKKNPFSILNKFIKNENINIHSKIINRFAPNNANLFCLNIFGIR